MGAYTFNIESAEGVGTPELLDRLAEALDGSEAVRFPAIGLDPETHALSLVFEVEGESAFEAAQRGMDELGRAFGEASRARKIKVSAELAVGLPVERLEVVAA